MAASNDTALPSILIGRRDSFFSKTKFTLVAENKTVLLTAEWAGGSKTATGSDTKLTIREPPSSTGTSKEPSVLAWTSGSCSGDNWAVDVRCLSGSASTIKIQAVVLTKKFTAYQFQVPIRNQMESFEWRNRYDGNVQIEGDDWIFGWKLVWLTGPDGTPGSTGYTQSGKPVIGDLKVQTSRDLAHFFRLDFTPDVAKLDADNVLKLTALASGMHLLCEYK